MLIGGGGGCGAITGNTYQIKTMAVTPASASGMKASEIEALFSYLDPSAVAEAGKAHTAAAKTLQSIADSLVRHAQALADGWSGTSAQASITAFQQLHQTAVQLAQASAQIGQVLTWLGEAILPYYKNWKAPSNGVIAAVESLLGSNPQDHAAQQVMQRLNDRLSQANAGLPASISIDPPKIGQAGYAPTATGAGGSSRGAGAVAAGVGLTGGARVAISPVSSGGGVNGIYPGGVGMSGHSPGGGLGVVPTGPGGHTVSPIHLAGSALSNGTPPGASGLQGAPGGVSGGPAPSGVANGPGSFSPVPMPGPDTVPATGGTPELGDEPPSAVGILPGEPVESAVMGSDGMIGTGPGMAEREFGSGNAGATGFVGTDNVATQPGSGLPMTGGSGGGRRENERYRQAWMAEDADTWESRTSSARS